MKFYGTAYIRRTAHIIIDHFTRKTAHRIGGLAKAFEEADRVVNAIKHKLELDEALRAAFKTDSIEFLRRQKLQDSIKEAFLSNADEFLNFMSKTETDSGFGKFFFSEMFKWYEQTVSAGGPSHTGH